jgi:glycolate oxidase FAD binding subunit
LDDDAVLARLATICGGQYARLANPADAVAGVPARFVAAPAHTAQAAALLCAAAELELTTLPRGGGTKLDWCARPGGVDLIVDTSRLTGVRQHTYTEAAVTVGAGTRLEALAISLAATGQRFAVDGFPPGATVGGVIAADAAGPCRLDHGPPRRLLLGAVVVTGDGRQTRVGVPASAAPVGLDLGGLFAGSFGALGLLTEVTVRLHPVPTARRFLWRPVRSPLEAHELTMQLMAAEVSPSAIELDLPAMPEPVPGAEADTATRSSAAPTEAIGTLAVGLETGLPDTDGLADLKRRAEVVRSVLGGDVAVDSRPPAWWGTAPFRPDDVALALTAPPAYLHAALYALRDAAGGLLSPPVRGSAGCGTVHAGLPGDLGPERVAQVVDAVRTTMTGRGGTCVVLRAPASVLSRVDVWGEVAGVDLIERVKAAFDPSGRMAPGRLPGATSTERD